MGLAQTKTLRDVDVAQARRTSLPAKAQVPKRLESEKLYFRVDHFQ